MKNKNQQRQLTFVMVYLTIDKRNTYPKAKKTLKIIQSEDEKEQATRFPPDTVIQHGDQKIIFSPTTWMLWSYCVMVCHPAFNLEKNFPLLKKKMIDLKGKGELKISTITSSNSIIVILLLVFSFHFYIDGKIFLLLKCFL